MIQPYNGIVYNIANPVSLYSSLSTRYFDLGSLPKVRNQFRLLLFFKRTILLLIHHQFLQFWYQCIKKTSIYRIIGYFPPNCRRNTRKTDKVTVWPWPFGLLLKKNILIIIYKLFMVWHWYFTWHMEFLEERLFFVDLIFLWRAFTNRNENILLRLWLLTYFWKKKKKEYRL